MSATGDEVARLDADAVRAATDEMKRTAALVDCDCNEHTPGACGETYKAALKAGEAWRAVTSAFWKTHGTDAYACIWSETSEAERSARVRMSQAERAKIFERDGWQCLKCSDNADLEIHHILEVCNGGTNDPTNLITLCKSCHGEWTHLLLIRCVGFETWLKYPPAQVVAAAFIFMAEMGEDAGVLQMAERLRTDRSLTADAKKAARRSV